MFLRIHGEDGSVDWSGWRRRRGRKPGCGRGNARPTRQLPGHSRAQGRHQVQPDRPQQVGLSEVGQLLFLPSALFCDYFMIFYLIKICKCTFKKVISKKNLKNKFLVCILKVKDENCRIRIDWSKARICTNMSQIHNTDFKREIFVYFAKLFFLFKYNCQGTLNVMGLTKRRDQVTGNPFSSTKFNYVS